MTTHFSLLLAALAGLLFGPILLQIRRDVSSWQATLDGFTLVAVGGMAAFHLIPEALQTGGAIAVLFAILGALMPLWSHHYSVRLNGRGEVLILLLALIPHVALEGAALGVASTDKAISLGIAVAAHRLPVGLLLFFFVRNRFGNQYAWSSIVGLLIATLLGFAGGDALAQNISETGVAWFQALVGGSLLHVAFAHRILADGHNSCSAHGSSESHNHSPHAHGSKSERVWSSLGALAGIGILILTLGVDHHHSQPQHGFTSTLFSLSLQTAPALLIAYVLAGLIGVFVTPATTQWLSRGSSRAQALRGVAFGLPLPICSCGVLPVYESLVKKGVPTVAAMGFLVATPELGLDAILISIPLLGQEMTFARLGAAFLVAIVTALVVGPLVKRTPPCKIHNEQTIHRNFNQRIRAGIRFGLIDLFDHTMPWVLAGLLMAAWAEPVLGHGLLDNVPPFLQVPLFALIGIPLYVCASGATPIAAIAIHKGISPGAGLAFLLAGPATNITTFGILNRLHGKRIAVAFGCAVTTVAVLLGWAVDLLAIDVLANLHSHQHHEGSPLQWAALSLLLLLFIGSLVRQGPRGIVEQVAQPNNHTH